MNTDDIQDFLQHWDWRDLFDARTVERGEDYFLDGHVAELQHHEESDRDVLAAVVDGSGKRPYRCQIALLRDDKKPGLRSACSCPMAVNCKHVVAALMEAELVPAAEWTGAVGEADEGDVALDFYRQHPARTTAQPAAPDLSEWTRWLDRLQHATTTPSTAMIAGAERRFALLLRANGAQLLVKPAWLRPGKAKSAKAAGTWVDPQPIVLGRSGPEPLPAEGWPAGIATALAALMQGYSDPMGGQPWWAVEAAHQEDALQDLVARYPLYFERGNAPLTLGERLPLQWRWADLADGSQRLEAQVEADGEQALLLVGATRVWYLFKRALRFGVVDAAADMLSALRSAPPPPVQAEQVDALRALVAQKGEPLQLPAPAARPAAERLEVAPVPVLMLDTFTVSYGYGTPSHGALFGFARLAFDYDAARVNASESAARVRRWDGTHLLDVQRAPQREQQVADALRKVGLSPVGWQAYQNRELKETDWVLNRTQARASRPPADWAPVIDQLTAAGFRIEYGASFPHERAVAIDDWHAALKPAGAAWFDVTLGIDVAGERIDLLPLLRQMIANPRFPLAPAKSEKKNATWRIDLGDNRYAEVPLAKLRALIEPLLEWLGGDSSGSVRVHRTQAAALEATGLAWHGDAALRAQIERMRKKRTASRPPKTLQATLRPYQIEGLTWLDFLAEAGLGGILADDMGLGKTVQLLAHLLALQERGALAAPALVVCPTSLVGNWQAEAERFAPTLRVLVLRGAERAERFDAIAQHDLVITTYPLLPRDQERLLQARFSLLVLDEAQAIKNAASQAARVVRKLPAERRVALTGTPLENHLGELWAEFDAVEPGLLGNQRQFTRFYRTPIEKQADGARQQRLNRRVGALLLRRRKDDVLTDLPPKTEIIRTLELEGAQRALYEALRLAQHQRVQEAVAKRGLARSGIIVLDALLKLRQACCDPRLVRLDSAKKVKGNAKLEALLELLDGLLGDGRRILLFSQFTAMLELIEKALAERGIAWQTLTGQTPARQRSALVQRFQNGAVPLFLISLKAGGVGLNLTAADSVIHYDPWWNPAVERQATDRAHRIGQTKPVFVYRLICKDTVEEKIQKLQARKAELAQAVLEGGGASQRLRFDADDLEALFETG